MGTNLSSNLLGMMTTPAEEVFWRFFIRLSIAFCERTVLGVRNKRIIPIPTKKNLFDIGGWASFDFKVKIYPYKSIHYICVLYDSQIFWYCFLSFYVLHKLFLSTSCHKLMIIFLKKPKDLFRKWFIYNCNELINEADILYNEAKQKKIYIDDLYYIQSMNHYINKYEKFKEKQIRQYITDLKEYIK